MASAQGEPTNAPKLPFFGEVAGKTFDDPAGIPSLEVLQADTRRTVTFVEEATGLVSRWNGDVLVSDETDANGDPKFTGRKEPNCPITLHRVILGHKERYLTSLHEALHSVSVGMPMGDGYSYWRSYEEGVVTALTELLAPQLAIKIDVELPVPTNSYPRISKMLDYFRQEAGLTKEIFYLTLLQMPVRARKAGIKSMIADQRGVSVSELEQDKVLMEKMAFFAVLLF